MDKNKKEFVDSTLKKTPSKKKSKKSKIKKVILAIVILVIFILSSVIGYFYFTLSNVNTVELDKSNKGLAISPDVVKKLEEIKDPPVTIALFGVDRRTEKEVGNSDTILIATIDKEHKKIKLTSIMRDSRVAIPGFGLNKINSAYLHGGPQLAVKTLNQNFGLAIKDYVTVDFYSMDKIITQLGGVKIDVKQNEIQFINDYQTDTASHQKVKPVQVTKPGLQTLNGLQAVGYSRIRYIGNDQQRTERQRTVLTALLNKVMSGGVASFPSTAGKLTQFVETSLSTTDIVSLGLSALNSGTKNIVQARFPLDSYLTTPTIDGVSYVVYDLATAKQQLFDYIYKDITPQEKK